MRSSFSLDISSIEVAKAGCSMQSKPISLAISSGLGSGAGVKVEAHI
jgi:hypothetical protein